MLLSLLLCTPAVVYSMIEDAADRQSIIELGNGCSGASLYVTDNVIIPLVLVLLFEKEEDCKKLTQKKCKTCNSMKRKLGMTV